MGLEGKKKVNRKGTNQKLVGKNINRMMTARNKVFGKYKKTPKKTVQSGEKQ